MPPDNPSGTPPTLTDKLQELEQLIPDREGSGSRSVPVLDDLVEPGDADAASRNFDDLEQRLQQRLDAELADLAGVLKGVIKRCISEELSARSPDPGAEHSEAPSEPSDRD